MSNPMALRQALQKERIRLLYRRALKNTMDWAVHREVFYTEASKLRARFDANKDMVNPVQIETMLAKGEKELEDKTHPDPYIIPWAYGGSKYARNAPLPPGIEIVYDYGKEEYY